MENIEQEVKIKVRRATLIESLLHRGKQCVRDVWFDFNAMTLRESLLIIVKGCVFTFGILAFFYVLLYVI